jgi:hypothetical protein
MQYRPTALGYVDPDISVALQWDCVQVGRLARQLGYLLIWLPEDSLLPLVDVVRQLDVDTVIVPSPAHLNVLTLNSLMYAVDVESVVPRLSFTCWIVRQA